MNKETEPIWITKYALSKGIYTDYLKVKGDSAYGKWLNDCFHGEGREWCRTKESAVKRAEEMRTKRIASLRKQIEKLEKMRFIVGEKEDE